jgi:hypothetical protein
MVQFTEETARKNITINDKPFTVPQPFAEGHVLTANEASALNQVLSENVRNNIAPRIKKGEEINQASIDDYVAKYEFGIRSVSTTDPVQKEMRKLAEEALNKKLAASGHSKSKLTKEQYNEMVDAILAEHQEKLYARAVQIIELRSEDISL